MALLSVQRSQSLGKLYLEYMFLDKSQAVFYIPELVKNSTPKFHPHPLEFPAYPNNSRVCVVLMVEKYLLATNRFTKNLRKGPLFLSYAYPKPISNRTIAKYVVKFLGMAGIDLTTFSAHSTRGASTSLAKAKGLS